MTAIAAESLHRPVPVRHRVPLTRVTQVELRKMFNTRSGFWLIASIAISAVLATGGVILWAPDDQLTYSTFATAIRFPVVVILPLIAILAVTSEWSQRTGLTTFTLIPHRSRIITAKAISSVLIAVAAMVLTFAVGALGNLLERRRDRHHPGVGRDADPVPVLRPRHGPQPVDRVHARRAHPLLDGRDRGLLRPDVPAAHDLRPAGHQPAVVPRPAALDRHPVRPERTVRLRPGPDRRAVGQHRRHRRHLAAHPPGDRARDS